MEKRLLNIKELSTLIGVSVSTLYTWVSQRRIPYVKCGHSVRFDLEDINKWITKLKVEEKDFDSCLRRLRYIGNTYGMIKSDINLP